MVTSEKEKIWYSNTYKFVGWTNPTSDSLTTVGDFAYVGDNVKSLYSNKKINMVRLVPAKAGKITINVYNYSSNIIGNKDTILLRDNSKTAFVLITQEMVDKGGYQEIPLSKTLYIGENQFWSIGTSGDTGLFKFSNNGSNNVDAGYRMYNFLGTDSPVSIPLINVALCVDMGYY